MTRAFIRAGFAYLDAGFELRLQCRSIAMTRASQQLRGDAADVGAIEIETNAADEVVEVLFFAQARVSADGTGLRAL